MDFVFGIEIDFILDDLADHDFELIFALEIDQRPAAGIQGDEPFLNERREFEPPAHFVDDFFFFQFFEHGASGLGVFVSRCLRVWAKTTRHVDTPTLSLLQNTQYFVDGFVDGLVRYLVAVQIGLGQLAAGHIQAALGGLFRFRRPAAEPAF